MSYGIMKVINPSALGAARGYSNGVAASGQTIYIAGQIGWDAQQKLVSDKFVEQLRQVLVNIVAVLEAAGASPEHLVRMTWYVKDKREYQNSQSEIGTVYREIIGRHFPAMSLFQVSDLLEDGALVEIEATAVIPEN